MSEKKHNLLRSNAALKEHKQTDEATLHQLRLAANNPILIERRLEEVEQEWDLERTLELNASAVALTGIVLGAFVNRKWLVLPALVSAFLAQQAIQGWCPPLPLFRKLGLRTRREIDKEKFGLKTLRGDFKKSSKEGDTAWQAVNK